jgi:hypothetical protein
MLFTFLNTETSASTDVRAITETVNRGGGDQNLGGNVVNNEEIPIMRHSNARNGSFKVEPDYENTLAELLALHSGTGEGKFRISIDGLLYAYRAVVTVSMTGKLGQIITISWKGSDG